MNKDDQEMSWTQKNNGATTGRSSIRGSEDIANVVVHAMRKFGEAGEVSRIEPRGRFGSIRVLQSPDADHRHSRFGLRGV